MRALKILTAIGVVMGAATALLPLGAESRDPRALVLVARGMTFYAGEGAEPNPTIHMEPGERLRVTLVNEDAGVTHDFAVNAWSARTSVLRGKGRASIVIQAPPRAGTAEYSCSLHGSMMSGTIQVGSRP